MGDVITFDVGGTIFKTLLPTVTLGVAKATLFPSLVECKRSKAEPIFLDRDATAFRFVLNFLRDPAGFVPPRSVELIQQLLQEADYFLLPDGFTETLRYTSPLKTIVPDSKLVLLIDQYFEGAPSCLEPGLLEHFSLKHQREQLYSNSFQWIFDQHELRGKYVVVRMWNNGQKAEAKIEITFSNDSKIHDTIDVPGRGNRKENSQFIVAKSISSNPELLLKKIHLYWHHEFKDVVLDDLEVYGTGRRLRIPMT